MKRLVNDLFLIGGLLLICGITLITMGLTSKSDNLTAKVYYNSDVIVSINLDDNSYNIYNKDMVEYSDGIYIIKSETTMKLKVEDKKIRVIETGCPDSICKNQGYISSSGQTITCLPNRISITLSSKKGVDVSI